MDDLVGLLDHLWIRAGPRGGILDGGGDRREHGARRSRARGHRDLRGRSVLCRFSGRRPSVRAVRCRAGAWRRDSRRSSSGFFPRGPTRPIAAIVPQLEATNDSASLVASLRALPALMLDPARVARATTPALAIVSVKDPLRPTSRFIAQRWPGMRLVELDEGRPRGHLPRARACDRDPRARYAEIAKMADVRIQNSEFEWFCLNSEFCILTSAIFAFCTIRRAAPTPSRPACTARTDRSAPATRRSAAPACSRSPT